jgi:hypothetical protein
MLSISFVCNSFLFRRTLFSSRNITFITMGLQGRDCDSAVDKT